jgi:alginate O-acetyltransferase complex protein AlgJ
MKTLRFPSLNRTQLFALALIALLALPLASTWNIFAGRYLPGYEIRFGRELRGVVTPPPPFQWSWRAFADGTNQRAIANEVTRAIPVRRALVRVNNQIRFKLFGQFGAPGVLRGEDGHLIEQGYLDEYCARDLAAMDAPARMWASQLKELQDFIQARGHAFIYLITPSKVAHFPEAFVHRFPCKNTQPDREGKVPAFVGMLKQAGVNVVDTATLTHSMKGKYEVGMFPQGGVHWNQLAVAYAANALIGEINRQRKTSPIAPLKWTFTISNKAAGEDRDLFDLLNILIARPEYKVPIVSYVPRQCGPEAKLNVAVIGGSFIHVLSETLARSACFRGLKSYNYLYYGQRGGPAYAILRRERMTPQDILPIADADVVILEENESVFPQAVGHATELYKQLLKKN